MRHHLPFCLYFAPPQPKSVVRQQSLFLLDDGCVTIFHSISIPTGPNLSPDSRRSFHRITDAPSISYFLFPLVYRPTRVTPSYTLFSFLSSRVYRRPTHVTPSYTLFSFLSLHIYRPTHVTPLYTLFSFLSPHNHRPTHVTPSYTLFTFPFLFHHLSLQTSSTGPLLHTTCIHSRAMVRNSIPGLLTFYDFLRLSTTSPLRRTPEGPTPIRPHYDLHVALYPAYSTITTFPLPRTPEGPTLPIRARAHTYTQLYTLPIPIPRLRLFLCLGRRKGPHCLFARGHNTHTQLYTLPIP
ncbi:hypothetical protein BDR07DRAFT_1611458 [Suillus spraguei]|nr:hypothetical protein BDR07DRAFT_1611458 [Suillus spraguei]